jgi:hypothetical protein
MQVMTGLTTARVRLWSKATPRAPRHDWMRLVTYDRMHHRVRLPLRALYRPMNSVRRMSSHLAEPVSGSTQLACPLPPSPRVT